MNFFTNEMISVFWGIGNDGIFPPHGLSHYLWLKLIEPILMMSYEIWK